MSAPDPAPLPAERLAALDAFLVELNAAAGAAILPLFRGDHGLSNKFEVGFDPVTEADKGGGGWDVITYYQGYKPLYRELKILSPLDSEQVPNLKNLYPYFQGDQGSFWVEPDGTRTGVPWDYGAIGITLTLLTYLFVWGEVLVLSAIAGAVWFDREEILGRSISIPFFGTRDGSADDTDNGPPLDGN